MYTDEPARSAEAVIARHLEWSRCLGGSGAWHDMVADCVQRRKVERPATSTLGAKAPSTKH